MSYFVLKIVFFVAQVAALSFGDFYNTQYVKMYSIFMEQLKVQKIIFCVGYFNMVFTRKHLTRYNPVVF